MFLHVHKYGDLIWELVRTDFKQRYQHSILGIIWVVLKPLLLFAILYFVFSFFFGAHDPHYRLNLLLGVITFSYFSEATTRGLLSLYDRSNIILKVNFPQQIAVLAPIINAFINFLINLGIFFIFWLFSPTPLTWYWFFVPVYVILLTAIIIGLSWFTSVLFVLFRDLLNIWEVGLSLMFYLTPIIYPINLIPAKFHKVMILNPLTATIRDVRLILVQQSAPGILSFVYLFLEGLFLCVGGYYFFKKYIKKSMEKL